MTEYATEDEILFGLEAEEQNPLPSPYSEDTVQDKDDN